MNKREYLLPTLDIPVGNERQTSMRFDFTIPQRLSTGVITMTDTVPFIHNADPDIILDVNDPPGAGGAHHVYIASVMGQPERKTDGEGAPYISRKPTSSTVISFQHGGKAEVGANGLTNEILLEIVRHRLACFQAGDFACKENESALNHVIAAVEQLRRRTAKRVRRGVEGKEIK